MFQIPTLQFDKIFEPGSLNSQNVHTDTPDRAALDVVEGFWGINRLGCPLGTNLRNSIERIIPKTCTRRSCRNPQSLLDSFAYLCDVQKGGATVTAAGLQKLPESNILWLAANEGVRNDIKIYAENILLKLKNLNPNSEQDAQDEIFHLAVERCSPRIIVYQDEMKRLARNCRMQLKREMQNDTVMSLRRKLRKLSEPPPSMMLTDVVDFCYRMRGLDIDEIKRRSKNALDDYDKLAHYIGRLGATRSSVLAVIKGMMRIPALQQISCIRTVEAPGIKEVALDQWALSPYEVFRGICQDPVSQNPLQNAAALHSLVVLDLPSGSADRVVSRTRYRIAYRVSESIRDT
ncbi:hypothetical protein MGU_11004 [Metarhizium guizhouense ARSEF 977]|uniref:Uncharacterized protein n=1 Tax=Metarhizium guizhouense (strain ARSEF 977) TaxID=1276136 RepID=A0A0B4GVY5_METGA|nr:hypothetical protein MGU_11004 [Metarhizium guizhouense ARSEF 977]